MFKRAYNRLIELREKFRIHMHPMGPVNQDYQGLKMADAIMTEARHKVKRTGQILYVSLPHDMQLIVVKESFDPWKNHYSEADLRAWLKAHVIFDGEGNIIAIIDLDKVLAYRAGEEDAIKWFMKVRGFK